MGDKMKIPNKLTRKAMKESDKLSRVMRFINEASESPDLKALDKLSRKLGIKRGKNK